MNPWDFRNILVYGRARSVKTELMRWFAEIAMDRYSSGMLDVYNMGPNLPKWLAGPTFTPKPIQMYYFDDSDTIKLKRAEIQNWSAIRQIVKQATHQPEGILLTFIGTHEIFSLPKCLRENVEIFIARSIPQAVSFYDQHFMKRLLGANGYAMLEAVTEKRLRYEEHDEIIVFRILDEVGWMKTDLATTNYLCNYDWKQPIVSTKRVQKK